jgi:NAD(P)H-dependent FMN reductase
MTDSTKASAKLLIFAGSTSLASFNRKLAHATAGMARAAGAEVTHIELADFDIPIYNADLEAKGTPADVMKLKQIMFEHPAWIICSPEYNGSYTALLKNTIDWVSSPVKSDPAWQEGFKSFTGKACSAPHPAHWAACARKAIWCRCCSTRSAGWHPRPLHWGAPARLLGPKASCWPKRIARTCRR